MLWPYASSDWLSASSVGFTADTEEVPDKIDEERFVRRFGSDYAQAFAVLLPRGPAWPRDQSSVLMQLLRGLSETWGILDGRAADFLQRESDPRASMEMLEEWERAWGLPDPCIAEPLSISDRQNALVAKMTMLGGQSRDFFISFAALIGYEVRITEHAPFMCGVSECGDTRDAYSDWRWEIAPPEIRFLWNVRITGLRVTWFRAGNGGGQAGVDPMVRIALATDLDCVLRRYKPAHTELVFDYSDAAPL